MFHEQMKILPVHVFPRAMEIFEVAESDLDLVVKMFDLPLTFHWLIPKKIMN